MKPTCKRLMLSEHSEVRYILCNACAALSQAGNKHCFVRLRAKIGALCNRFNVMASDA
jgi:hypothetical protein